VCVFQIFALFGKNVGPRINFSDITVQKLTVNLALQLCAVLLRYGFLNSETRECRASPSEHATIMGCSHDPANVQQTSSKRPALARVF